MQRSISSAVVPVAGFKPISIQRTATSINNDGKSIIFIYDMSCGPVPYLVGLAKRRTAVIADCRDDVLNAAFLTAAPSSKLMPR